MHRQDRVIGTPFSAHKINTEIVTVTVRLPWHLLPQPPAGTGRGALCCVFACVCVDRERFRLSRRMATKSNYRDALLQ